MKKKLSKVLAVVLSLAMVLGLAAVDTTAVGQAAKKLKFTKTGKKAVKSGQKRTLKISGTKAKKAKWTVTGTGKKYIELAKTKGKTNSFTVKANATGTAKVTAKLTKKNKVSDKVSVTYKLSCDLTGIQFDSTANVETGATTKLNLAAVPTNAVLPETTYAVWMDAEKKTAKPETTVVTTTAVTGGVEFAASAPGTYYVFATVGEYESSCVVTVANHVAVLKAVKQKSLKELEFTFDSDCSYMKDEKEIQNVKDAIQIVDGNGTRHDVESITVDEKDNTKAYVKVLVDLKDGKENTVTYNGTEVKFTASNGEVTNVTLKLGKDDDCTTAPVQTTVPLKGVFRDANGVEIKTVDYGDYSDDHFEITVETQGEASEDSGNHSVRLESLTDTINVTTVYRSGKLNTTTNEPEEYKQSFVITAIPAGKITGVTNYTITTARDGDEQKYTTLPDSEKNKKEIKVNPNSTTALELFALVEDDLGYERVNGSLTGAGYILSSADDTYLQVNGDLLQGNRAGKTSVLVSDDNGNVLFTIPVTVLAAPKLTSFTVDKTSLILSAGNKSVPDPSGAAGRTTWGLDSKDIKIVPLDQYNEVYTDVSISVYNPESASKNYRKDYNTWSTETIPAADLYDADAKEFVVTASVKTKLNDGDYQDERTKEITSTNLKAGSSHNNTFTVEVKDTVFTETTLNKTVYVTTKQPKYNNVKSIKLEAPATINTTLNKKPSTNKYTYTNGDASAEIKVALYDGSGVFVAYDYLAVTKNAISIVKSGKTFTADKGYVLNDTAANTATIEIDNDTAKDKVAANITLGAIYFDDGEATGINATAAAMRFVYKSVKNVTGYSLTVSNSTSYVPVVTKADATRYTIKVANIDRISTGGKQNDFQKNETTCVTLGAASTKVITANIKVEDSQAVPKLTQLKKAMSTVGLGDVLANAYKVECSDTVSGQGKYDPSDEKNAGRYVLCPVEKGYVINEKGISFTKIKVLVPYPMDGGDIYAETTISAPTAVKAE